MALQLEANETAVKRLLQDSPFISTSILLNEVTKWL